MATGDFLEISDVNTISFVSENRVVCCVDDNALTVLSSNLQEIDKQNEQTELFDIH